MKASSVLVLVLWFACFSRSAEPCAQEGTLREEPLCVENSRERRGDFGCSIVENKQLPSGLRAPVFWHIDRFDTNDRARKAIGPSSVAFEAHGSWWLMSVGPQVETHSGGQHVANVNLGALPEAAQYSMLVISAYIPPGLTSRVHFHSGVEAFYAVDGEQCLETPERAYPMQKGETLVVPTGVTMRLIASGTKPRRAFAVIVYDSSKPPTTRMPMEMASQPAKKHARKLSKLPVTTVHSIGRWQHHLNCCVEGWCV